MTEAFEVEDLVVSREASELEVLEVAVGLAFWLAVRLEGATVRVAVVTFGIVITVLCPPARDDESNVNVDVTVRRMV